MRVGCGACVHGVLLRIACCGRAAVSGWFGRAGTRAQRGPQEPRPVRDRRSRREARGLKVRPPTRRLGTTAAAGRRSGHHAASCIARTFARALVRCLLTLVYVAPVVATISL